MKLLTPASPFTRVSHLASWPTTILLRSVWRRKACSYEESPKGGGHVGGRISDRVVAMAAFAVSIGMPLFPQSPASVVADTARHFWEAGNIQDPKFQEFHDELIEKSRGGPQGSYSQDFFTIGRDGNLYPKHSILFTVLPFSRRFFTVSSGTWGSGYSFKSCYSCFFPACTSSPGGSAPPLPRQSCLPPRR